MAPLRNQVTDLRAVVTGQQDRIHTLEASEVQAAPLRARVAELEAADKTNRSRIDMLVQSHERLLYAAVVSGDEPMVGRCT
jgi:hypothetical protein